MGDKMKYRLAKIPAYVFISITSITAVIPFYIMFVMGTYKNEETYLRDFELFQEIILLKILKQLCKEMYLRRI